MRNGLDSEHHVLILSHVLYLLGGQVTSPLDVDFTESRHISRLALPKSFALKMAKGRVDDIVPDPERDETTHDELLEMAGSPTEGLRRRLDLRFQLPKQLVHTRVFYALRHPRVVARSIVFSLQYDC